MSYTVDQLSFGYDTQLVLDQLSFAVNTNEIFCILGPSGCGKTTLLKLLAGLLTPQAGEIGTAFSMPKSFLFQEPRLLPERTVYENLVFTTAHLNPSGSANAQIETYLKAVRLWDYRDHYPDELSGGMQQRVAIVRAFLHSADLMFLDEPFKSLDVEIKLSVMETFKALWLDHPKTVIMITHDVLAAALLGDRIMILSEKPTREVETIRNPLSREERSVYHEETARLQSKLYTFFLPHVNAQPDK